MKEVRICGFARQPDRVHHVETFASYDTRIIEIDPETRAEEISPNMKPIRISELDMYFNPGTKEEEKKRR